MSLSIPYETIQEELVEEISEINISEYNNQNIEDNVSNGEEITNESLSENISKSEDVLEFIQEDEGLDETDCEVSLIRCDEDSPCPKKIPPIPKRRHKEERFTIHCRVHCLEKMELDAINKSCNFQITSKFSLKLNPKKCCQIQTTSRLPTYNGKNSEYGLSEIQLEKKRQLEKIRKRQLKEKIMRKQEEKMEKDNYNEEIFCSWLKSVAKRTKNINNDKLPNLHPNRLKNSYQIYDIEKSIMKIRARPKTSPFKHYYNTIIVHPGATIKTVLKMKNTKMN